MDVTNATQAREYVEAWAVVGPRRREWMMRFAIEGLQKCAAIHADYPARYGE